MEIILPKNEASTENILPKNTYGDIGPRDEASTETMLMR